MSHDEKRAPERAVTDDSLRAERKKTDTELAAGASAVQQGAEGVVAQAREKADAVLSDARDLEDRKGETEGSSRQEQKALGHERAREDATLDAERKDADAVAADDSEQRERALASLLALERQDTDLRLEIERTRADEALTSREDFLAMVSHDLRSLLGGIALGADLLQKLSTTDEPIATAAAHAERIQRFAARMNRLIGDLLDVSSIEAGRLAVVPQVQDTALVVREAAEVFQTTAAARGILLACELKDDVIRVALDHERILQVLINLVGNALKFTGQGGRVTIRVAQGDHEVRFAIDDTGEGIPADRIERIFDRFYQSNRNDRRGLGLGLYIAKSIVEAHGGRIWAESTPGRGSTFFFTLPSLGK